MPPRLYGGIERVIDMLARGLEARGHEVALLAHPESASAGRLVVWPGRDSRSRRDTLRNAAALARETARFRPDIVHSFSRIAYLTPILPRALPKIMTYQRAISPRTVRLGQALSGGSLSFTAISEWMMREVAAIGRWDLVPNGVPLDRYRLRAEIDADAPFVFLGRVEEIKGPHLAIEIARALGAPLVIAGNVPAEKQGWFDLHIAPRIDGAQVRFVGPVDDAQKDALLGGARALLMPILWDEPFGIVMAEAMACGAPVLGLRRGAVPEVVEDGVTGFVRDRVEDLVVAAARLSEIDRRACRQRVETHYSDGAVVERYLAVYRARLGEKAAGAATAPADKRPETTGVSR